MLNHGTSQADFLKSPTFTSLKTKINYLFLFLTGSCLYRFFWAAPVRWLLKFVLIFLFCFSFFTSSAKDKIAYGYERLAVYDYFQARESFLARAGKQPVPAYYGLSIIASSHDNPFYNLDTARIYILIADSLFGHLTAEEEIDLKDKYHISAYQISSRKDSIAAIAYREVSSKNNVDMWNDYIGKYSWSSFSDSASQQRSNLAFSIAKAENRSKSYHDYFTNYPYTMQTAEARRRYEDCLFREQVASRTEKSYAAFINTYPESPYRMQAEDSLFAIATKQKSPEEYYAFAKKYSSNKNAPSAWMKLYHRYLELYSVQNLDDFFKNYPDFKYSKQVEEDFRLENVTLLPVRKNNHFTFISDEGKQVMPNLYDDVDEFSEGLCAVSKNGKYGYISKSGKIEIDFLFDEADPFENGFALVKMNGKATVINRDGETLFPAIYEEVGAPHDDRIFFLDSLKYGYLDTHGKIIIKPQFESAADFVNGMAVVGKEDALGIIDSKGNLIIAQKYSSIEIEENGLIKAEKDEVFGFLNRIGDEVLPVTYDAIGKFSSGLALIAKDDKCGYADANGNISIPLIYDFDKQAIDKSEFMDGFAVVKQKAKASIIDSTGNKIIPSLYDDLHFYKSDLPVAARRKGKWGYIDLDNKTLVPFKYDMVNQFSEGAAAVKLKNSFGVIDITGKINIPFNYVFISAFKKDVALIKRGSRFGLISKGGSVLIVPEFEKYQWVTDDVIRFNNGNLYGYYNAEKRDWIWREDGL